MKESPKLSLIFPVYNEAESLPHLFERLYGVIKENNYDYEIIAVNDGSRDDSFEVLKKFAKKDHKVKIVNFRVNAGQTAAIRAGIDHSIGDIIVALDSDLENDPRDLPLLLAELDKGYDVVSGWRQNRWQGQYLSRQLPSKIANALISKITGVTLNDYGCTFKVYRREVIQGVPLYGEMHRFIPAYASWRGAKVTEVPVRHEPRRFGKTNYGISRTFRVLLDLLLIKFFDKYKDRPMHFFGGFGFLSLLLGFVSAGAAIILRLFFDLHFVQTPLPVLTALFLITGVNLILMGIIAEMLMRTYYESRGEKPYLIKDKINIK
ncbi:MAG: glycosyltransferase family 2 protein [bacterium]|nr:glycosyltransferase family 2 protein [bacterium]